MIDVTQVIRGLDGEAIMVGENKERAWTLRLVCTRALTSLGTKDSDGEEKFERALLAKRIYDNDEVELKAEEISKLKDLIGRMFGPLVILRAWRMLDPAEREDTDQED